jgi:ribosomal-protein-alanine N-acetyltransferase
MPVPVLRTERTYLTVLRPEQSELVAEYYRANREHLQPWEPARDEHFYSSQAARERVDASYNAFLLGVSVAFAILDPSTKQMIATCHFSNIVRGAFQACNLGYSISKLAEGRGLMYEATQAGIQYMFAELHIHRIMANYMPANQRSERLLTRLGFEREGYARDYLQINGRWEDHVMTALINPAERKD